MLLFVVYVIMWFVSTLFFNRVHAVVDGEVQAKGLLILTSTLAVLWPITLPLVLMSIAVYKSSERLKEYFPGKK